MLVTNGNNQHLLLQPPVTYSAEATALFARMTTPPNTARKALIDACIVSLKAAGVWAKLDTLWVCAAADSQAATLNWVANNGTNLDISTGPAFVADRGFTNAGTAVLPFDGSPSAGPQYTLNSAHVAFWSRTAGLSALTSIEAGVGNEGISPRTSTNNIAYKVNDIINTAVANPASDGTGMYVASRPSAATKRVFRNGAQVGADAAVASSAITNGNFGVGGANTMNRQYAMAGFGADLTVQNVADYYTAMQTYMTAVGA